MDVLKTNLHLECLILFKYKQTAYIFSERHSKGRPPYMYFLPSFAGSPRCSPGQKIRRRVGLVGLVPLWKLHLQFGVSTARALCFHCSLNRRWYFLALQGFHKIEITSGLLETTVREVLQAWVPQKGLNNLSLVFFFPPVGFSLKCFQPFKVWEHTVLVERKKITEKKMHNVW